MSHPSLAFAWILWRRRRLSIFVHLGILLFMGTSTLLLSSYCFSLMEALDDNDKLKLFHLFLVYVGALIALSGGSNAFFFLLFDDVSTYTRESCLSSRMFRLPVSTVSLVIWPTVYGALWAILFWLVYAVIVLRPWAKYAGIEVPLWWPALFLAATMAWLPALFWGSVGRHWIQRIMLLFAIFFLFGSAVFSYFSYYREDAGAVVSEPLLVAMYAVLMLIGWVVGYDSVVRARCGQTTDRQAILDLLRKLVRWLWPSRIRPPFASAARAQVWYEWHRMWPWIEYHNDMSPFIATLPMSCADMVGAMFKTALWSTLLAWAVIFTTIPLVAMLTGKFQDLADSWQQIVHEQTPGAIVARITAITMWLLVWTWKCRVIFLYINPTGWAWKGFSVSFAYVFENVKLFFIALILTLYRPKIHETLLTLLPPVLTLLILCSLLRSARAFREILRQGLVETLTARRWLAAWLLVASTLFVLLALAVPAERVPVYYVALAVLFAMPMEHLTDAPLAVARNRHR